MLQVYLYNSSVIPKQNESIHAFELEPSSHLNTLLQEWCIHLTTQMATIRAKVAHPSQHYQRNFHAASNHCNNVIYIIPNFPSKEILFTQLNFKFEIKITLYSVFWHRKSLAERAEHKIKHQIAFIKRIPNSTIASINKCIAKQNAKDVAKTLQSVFSSKLGTLN